MQNSWTIYGKKQQKVQRAVHYADLGYIIHILNEFLFSFQISVGYFLSKHVKLEQTLPQPLPSTHFPKQTGILHNYCTGGGGYGW